MLLILDWPGLLKQATPASPCAAAVQVKYLVLSENGSLGDRRVQHAGHPQSALPVSATQGGPVLEKAGRWFLCTTQERHRPNRVPYSTLRVSLGNFCVFFLKKVGDAPTLGHRTRAPQIRPVVLSNIALLGQHHLWSSESAGGLAG